MIIKTAKILGISKEFSFTTKDNEQIFGNKLKVSFDDVDVDGKDVGEVFCKKEKNAYKVGDNVEIHIDYVKGFGRKIGLIQHS